jgi:hypothetical protein
MKTEYVNIKDIVSEISRKFQVDPARDWHSRLEINIRCNKCNDKKYHLGLSFAKDSYNCYRCENRGRLSDFLRRNRIKYEAKNRVAIVESLAVNAPKLNTPTDFSRDETIAKKAKEYLISRGFDLRFLKSNFSLWPITNSRHYYFGYIVVNVNEYAFYARKFLDLTPDKQRHVIRKSDPEMKLFYAFEKNNTSTLLVVESMFNLMKAAQMGYDALCIFGKGKHAGLVEYLRNKTSEKEICLCFDRDVTIKHVESFINKVQKSYGRTNLSYIDPSDMPCEDIAAIPDKTTLIRTINKRKPSQDLFISGMAIGD